jgi:hypothetical protein
VPTQGAHHAALFLAGRLFEAVIPVACSRHAAGELAGLSIAGAVGVVSAAGSRGRRVRAAD